MSVFQKYLTEKHKMRYNQRWHFLNAGGFCAQNREREPKQIATQAVPVLSIEYVI